MTVLANEQVDDGRRWRSSHCRAAQSSAMVHAPSPAAPAAAGPGDPGPLARRRCTADQQNWIRDKSGPAPGSFAGPVASAYRRRRCGLHDAAGHALWRRELPGHVPDPSCPTGLAGSVHRRRLHRQGAPGRDVQAEDRGGRAGLGYGPSASIIPLIRHGNCPSGSRISCWWTTGPGRSSAAAHDQRDLDCNSQIRPAGRTIVLPPGEDPATFHVKREAYVDPRRIFG